MQPVSYVFTGGVCMSSLWSNTSIGSEHQLHMQSSCLCVSSMLTSLKSTETDRRTNVTALWHSHRTVETQNHKKNRHRNLKISQTSYFSISSSLLTADASSSSSHFLCAVSWKFLSEEASVCGMKYQRVTPEGDTHCCKTKGGPHTHKHTHRHAHWHMHPSS